MSLACIAAARLRIVSLRLAVAVAVLGGIGPFFGSYEFVREQRAASARRRPVDERCRRRCERESLRLQRSAPTQDARVVVDGH